MQHPNPPPVNFNEVKFHLKGDQGRIVIFKLVGESEDDFTSRVIRARENGDFTKIVVMINFPQSPLMLAELVLMIQQYTMFIWIEEPVGGVTEEHKGYIHALQKAYFMAQRCVLDFNWVVNLKYMVYDKETIKKTLVLLSPKHINRISAKSRVQKLPVDLIRLVSQVLIIGH